MAITDILSGAASLGRSLLTASRAVDVVAILGSGFAPMFAQARPLMAEVFEYADLMEHPLENGAVIADHIVFQPIEIELPLLCVGEAAYRSTYAAIKGAFTSGQLLTVQTRTDTYANMAITDLPHEETPEQFDAIAIRLKLREAKFVTPRSELSQADTKNPAQSSTVNRGNQQTTPTSSASAGKAGDAYKRSGGGSTLYRFVYDQ